jgi:hypothetical protein
MPSCRVSVAASVRSGRGGDLRPASRSRISATRAARAVRCRAWRSSNSGAGDQKHASVPSGSARVQRPFERAFRCGQVAERFPGDRLHHESVNQPGRSAGTAERCRPGPTRARRTPCPGCRVPAEASPWRCGSPRGRSHLRPGPRGPAWQPRRRRGAPARGPACRRLWACWYRLLPPLTRPLAAVWGQRIARMR